MEAAQKQKRRGNRYCGVVTLDVKNAFNSASWAAIGDSLHRLKVLEYLCRILRSYFQNRQLIYETDAAKRSCTTVRDCIIDSKREAKQLGVMIDDRLSFNSHIDHACGKTVKVISALSRIIPNNSAISSNKKRLLASVSTSVLRHAGPARVTALQTKRNTSWLNSTFRLMVMRVSSAYRTISSEAVYVIGGTIPINLLLEEDSECYRDRGTRGVRKRVRADTLIKW
ncbi:uncharacterized protein LOC131688186 [Topomyia yanbarensis]|uniref:uncharacterized protein LOC131688183 n=1 Tax=Topomyia yanbarensis TaxID=2498891 RepID=UPI00273BAB35|nr:uncharacterized protein LOC131688183 [Topomyia yanbarensis]XP_058828338.1 uncharacterized protein LOC131688186 [Topomyia yanbarensis]